MNNNDNNVNTCMIEGKIKNKNVMLKLDTGALCNYMPLDMLKELGFSENNISKKSVGSIIIKCLVKGTECKIKFQEVKGGSISNSELNAYVLLSCYYKKRSLKILKKKHSVRKKTMTTLTYRVLIKNKKY